MITAVTFCCQYWPLLLAWLVMATVNVGGWAVIVPLILCTAFTASPSPWRHRTTKTSSVSPSDWLTSCARGRADTDFWIRIWFYNNYMATHLVLVWAKSLRLRRFKLGRNKIWLKCSLCNTHRLTESDFWCDVILSWRQSWRLPAARCGICSSVPRLPASPPSAYNVIGSLYAPQFLIHSTFLFGCKYLETIS